MGGGRYVGTNRRADDTELARTSLREINRTLAHCDRPEEG